MRAVRIHEYGGPSVLQVEEVPRPTPRANEVLVEMRAVGVNPTDAVTRRGDRPDQLGGGAALPTVPGADLAGVVTDVGADVERFAVGDRVFGTGFQNDRQGSYAEYVPARVDRLARLPDGVSFEEGGAAGVVGVTAWRGLVDYASLAPTETCLVHGGSGGVGHVAVQLASRIGSRVVATAGREDARERVGTFGADVVLDYRRDDLKDAVREAAPDGVDVVLDHRVGEYLQFDVDVSTGTVVVVGGPDDTAELTDLWPALATDLEVRVFSMSNIPRMADVLTPVARLLSAGDIAIHLARTYPLAEAAAAHEALDTDHFVGKAVLVP